jgi:hypothetical protein
MKESQVATTEKYIMTTAKEATDKDFEQMMQMLTGFWVTQIAGAVATYSIADHLAKGPASAEEISKMAGIDSIAAFRLLRACASLGLVTFNGLTFTATPLARSHPAIRRFKNEKEGRTSMKHDGVLFRIWYLCWNLTIILLILPGNENGASNASGFS